MEVTPMFAIQPINKFYKEIKYLGVRKDTGLPYPVYGSDPDCYKKIKDFETKESAIEFLTKFISRDNIDVTNLSISQIVDISLVNNANQFQIIEYEIENNSIKVTNTYPQSQFTREGWYKV